MAEGESGFGDHEHEASVGGDSPGLDNNQGVEGETAGDGAPAVAAEDNSTGVWEGGLSPLQHLMLSTISKPQPSGESNPVLGQGVLGQFGGYKFGTNWFGGSNNPNSVAGEVTKSTEYQPGFAEGFNDFMTKNLTAMTNWIPRTSNYLGGYHQEALSQRAWSEKAQDEPNTAWNEGYDWPFRTAYSYTYGLFGAPAYSQKQSFDGLTGLSNIQSPYDAGRYTGINLGLDALRARFVLGGRLAAGETLSPAEMNTYNEAGTEMAIKGADTTMSMINPTQGLTKSWAGDTLLGQMIKPSNVYKAGNALVNVRSHDFDPADYSTGFGPTSD